MVGVPTGTVTFEDGSSSIASGTLTTSGSDGVYTFTSSTLAYGVHTLSAVYAGDTNFTGGTSNSIPQTVNQASTTTTLSPLNPTTVGRTVTFTATVTVTNPGSAVLPFTNGGTVTFSDGSNSIGTGLLDSSGVATFTTSSLSQDNHYIMAVYGGDANYGGSESSTLTQVVNPPSFQVTTFTPTATGFTADFNRQLSLCTVDSPVLNLYDDRSGALGPPDVTLVRASNGASIRGSLVVNAAGTQITYAETGESGVLGSAASCTLFGVLPNDTYTVTLRSATNGFKDTSNNLLDGNADGTPGDDYVTTFVVNNLSNSVTVTLPDFSRGAGQLVNVPNTASANDTFTSP